MQWGWGEDGHGVVLQVCVWGGEHRGFGRCATKMVSQFELAGALKETLASVGVCYGVAKNELWRHGSMGRHV